MAIAMQKLQKLKHGDKVAVITPSFGASGRFPHFHELGLQRLRTIFNVEPVEYPTTRALDATDEEKMPDLVAAFEDPQIKAVLATLGGDHQITYVKKLPKAVFEANPKPFFGYSDNTHLANFLWLRGVPSFYGGSLLCQFALGANMDDFTVKYLKKAMFDDSDDFFELEPSEDVMECGLEWAEVSNLGKMAPRRPNTMKWIWHCLSPERVEGITWGGCLESIDELLRHRCEIPTLEQFKEIVLFTETCEEAPPAHYVFRVFRGLGELGILARCRGFLVGRPKVSDREHLATDEECDKYRETQYQTIAETIRRYNKSAPIVMNVDFGHTDPQIALPYGKPIAIDCEHKKIYCKF